MKKPMTPSGEPPRLAPATARLAPATARLAPATARLAPATPRLAPAFVVTSLGAFLVSLDVSIVNVAFPALAHAFPQASRADLAWVVTAYSIVFGALLVVGGRTGDRLGLRRVFFAGLGGFLAGSALCGLAPSVALLVAGRIVQGAGAAFLLPTSVGLLLSTVPREKRSQYVALWSGVGALAVATGPTLGSVLVAGPGWRWAFYVNLPVGALAYFLGKRVLPRDEARFPTRASRPDFAGALLLSLAVAAVTLAIFEGGERGLADPLFFVPAVVGPILGALFVLRSARHAAPVLDLQLFRSRAFAVANLATLAYAMAFFAVLLANILFLTEVWRYPIVRAGLAVTPGPLVVAAVSGFAGRAAARFGFRALLVPGSACLAAALAWFAFGVGAEPAYVAQWLPGTLLVGLGIGLTFPVLSAAAVSTLPHERFGVGSAVNQTARQVGGAIGVALMVVLLGGGRGRGAELAGFERVWLYGAIMASLSGAVAALLGKTPAHASALHATPSLEPAAVREPR